MREILFRGKRVDNGEWVYGYLCSKRTIGVISLIGNFDEYVIDPDTIGQYTGLCDKSGLTKIFEYDIIDENGEKVGNYYENKDLLQSRTYFLIGRMGTKKWVCSEQEAIKRGCKYAE